MIKVKFNHILDENSCKFSSSFCRKFTRAVKPFCFSNFIRWNYNLIFDLTFIPKNAVPSKNHKIMFLNNFSDKNICVPALNLPDRREILTVYTAAFWKNQKSRDY